VGIVLANLYAYQPKKHSFFNLKSLCFFAFLAFVFKPLRINAFYQDYVESFLVRITSMFEPIMLIVMGGLIGVMLIGVFLPIFQIANLG